MPCCACNVQCGGPCCIPFVGEGCCTIAQQHWYQGLCCGSLTGHVQHSPLLPVCVIGAALKARGHQQCLDGLGVPTLTGKHEGRHPVFVVTPHVAQAVHILGSYKPHNLHMPKPRRMMHGVVPMAVQLPAHLLSAWVLQQQAHNLQMAMLAREVQCCGPISHFVMAILRHPMPFGLGEHINPIHPHQLLCCLGMALAAGAVQSCHPCFVCSSSSCSKLR
ncbi:hypothetical protein DUNSADRAFT_7067 [Dunaliella salina]|uniref:Encoded protein n=1 Tax=Dunaliella salina TaxID=3046 RepID=A0ABQ7H6J3_DUNSA|nr:hypothetical protein DUNSADRAFT_7067 [Dunaliella salina]|eukprot:KAF5842458.1 hypothetical protein DUNSADRAFT_7067 [Dunaliella salina]